MKTTAKMIMGVIAGALLATGVALDTSYAAGPADGARCPNGFTANFSNNVLRCTRTQEQFADAVCPPPTAIANVEIVRQRGRDRCKVPLTPIPRNPNTLPSVVCATLPGGGTWTLQTDVAGFNDRCRRQNVEYACPVASPQSALPFLSRFSPRIQLTNWYEEGFFRLASLSSRYDCC
jgi:hypothetical protein